MEIKEAIESLRRIADLQTKTNDSGWVDTSSAYYRIRGVKDYQRTLHVDHNPNEKFIEALFSSAPFHTSKSHKVTADSENGLWLISLYACADSSD